MTHTVLLFLTFILDLSVLVDVITTDVIDPFIIRALSVLVCAFRNTELYTRITQIGWGDSVDSVGELAKLGTDVALFILKLSLSTSALFQSVKFFTGVCFLIQTLMWGVHLWLLQQTYDLHLAEVLEERRRLLPKRKFVV